MSSLAQPRSVRVNGLDLARMNTIAGGETLSRSSGLRRIFVDFNTSMAHPGRWVAVPTWLDPDLAEDLEDWERVLLEETRSVAIDGERFFLVEGDVAIEDSIEVEAILHFDPSAAAWDAEPLWDTYSGVTYRSVPEKR